MQEGYTSVCPCSLCISTIFVLCSTKSAHRGDTHKRVRVSCVFDLIYEELVEVVYT